MKQLLLLISVLVVNFCAAQSTKTTSGNPIFPGWYADPEAIIFDNKYWIYPTYSDKYEKQVFFDAFSSDDLIHWKKHDRVLDSSSVKWANKAMWAPAVVRNNKKYFFFFGANDIQSNDEYGGIGVAVSDDPAGPFKDHIGKPLIGKFYNGAQPIDQFVFHDSDSSWYIIYGGWQHCNIARLKNDFTGILPLHDTVSYQEITPEGYVEGPFMFKRGNKYYFMWSEGGWTGPDYSVAYAIGDSPFGPFKRIGKILQPDPNIAYGAGHHSVIHDNKDNWYIIYHRRPLGETAANHRITCIDEMHFDNDGKILPVKMTHEGVGINKLKP